MNEDDVQKNDRAVAAVVIVDRDQRKKTWEKVFEVINANRNSGMRNLIRKLEQARDEDT